jgi:ribosomal protein S12 methylthiotransferase accessory factor
MRQDKTFFTGTHRLVPPQQTWERIEPVLPMVGVSRVADITDLDTCGIPVAVAIRPAAKTLAVSAGKGVSRLLAKVGAAMESVELWHAEQPRTPDAVGSAADLGIPYPLDSLQLAPGSLLTPDTRLEWLLGQRLGGGAPALVPLLLVCLSAVVSDRWKPPMFLETSNGLASGNSHAEATQHALLEVIERQCLLELRSDPAAAPAVDLSAITMPTVLDLIDRLEGSGNLVRVLDITNELAVPCYYAEIRNEAMPFTFAGAGCHTATDVALCRAITEAAQSRLGAIAGSRDDLDDAFYQMGDDPARGRGQELPFPLTGAAAFPRDGIAALTFEEDVALLVSRILDRTGHEPILMDLTSPECAVPVVKVIAPGLGFDGRGSFRLGPTATGREGER